MDPRSDIIAERPGRGEATEASEGESNHAFAMTVAPRVEAFQDMRSGKYRMRMNLATRLGRAWAHVIAEPFRIGCCRNYPGAVSSRHTCPYRLESNGPLPQTFHYPACHLRLPSITMHGTRILEVLSTQKQPKSQHGSDPQARNQPLTPLLQVGLLTSPGTSASQD